MRRVTGRNQHCAGYAQVTVVWRHIADRHLFDGSPEAEIRFRLRISAGTVTDTAIRVQIAARLSDAGAAGLVQCDERGRLARLGRQSLLEHADVFECPQLVCSPTGLRILEVRVELENLRTERVAGNARVTLQTLRAAGIDPRKVADHLALPGRKQICVAVVVPPFVAVSGPVSVRVPHEQPGL